MHMQLASKALKMDHYSVLKRTRRGTLFGLSMEIRSPLLAPLTRLVKTTPETLFYIAMVSKLVSRSLTPTRFRLHSWNFPHLIMQMVPLMFYGEDRWLILSLARRLSSISRTLTDLARLRFIRTVFWSVQRQRLYLIPTRRLKSERRR